MGAPFSLEFLSFEAEHAPVPKCDEEFLLILYKMLDKLALSHVLGAITPDERLFGTCGRAYKLRNGIGN